MVDSVPALQRVIVHNGHGWHNSSPELGAYDPGASSDYGVEAVIVEDVAARVVDHYWLPRSELASSPHSISVIGTPICDKQGLCLSGHRGMSHLSYVAGVRDRQGRYTYNGWINDLAIKSRRGWQDAILSIHMNSADDDVASGVEVIIDDAAPVDRYYEAQEIARILSRELGLPNRGVKLDTQTPRYSLAIVEDTKPPAYLLELGFVTNPRDVQAVKECGAKAVIAVIEAMTRPSFGDRSRAVNRARK